MMPTHLQITNMLVWKLIAWPTTQCSTQKPTRPQDRSAHVPTVTAVPALSQSSLSKPHLPLHSQSARSGTFNSLSKDLFTLPSRYLCTIKPKAPSYAWRTFIHQLTFHSQGERFKACCSPRWRTFQTSSGVSPSLPVFSKHLYHTTPTATAIK